MWVRRPRWHHHVLLAAQPEHHGGDEHQAAGDAERHRCAEVVQEQRHQQRGEERAEVDDPVERVEHHLRQVLAGLVELVAHERCHQRLDAARAQRDQPQPGEKAQSVVLEDRQGSMPGAIHQAHPQHGVVLAEEAIAEPAAQQREEVHADHEGVEHVLRRQCALPLGQVQQQRGDQERGEDVAHPVEGKTLAAFVADDVGDLPRQAALGVLGGMTHRDSRNGGGADSAATAAECAQFHAVAEPRPAQRPC